MKTHTIWRSQLAETRWIFQTWLERPRPSTVPRCARRTPATQVHHNIMLQKLITIEIIKC